jgi:hypothetical protein
MACILYLIAFFDEFAVQKTTILLQRSARLAFWPSPYLDAFGEEVLINFLIHTCIFGSRAYLLQYPPNFCLADGHTYLMPICLVLEVFCPRNCTLLIILLPLSQNVSISGYVSICPDS